MASFPNTDDTTAYDPSGLTYPAGEEEDGGSAGGAAQGVAASTSPVDGRRDLRADAPPPAPPTHYPVHPLFQPPPGYGPPYGDPNMRRMPGYPADGRELPPPGLMAMYSGYPPTMHGWAPLDMYGRPGGMPPPDYRAADPRLVRMPGSSGKMRDSLGISGDEGPEKEGKRPQKKTEVACNFCRTRKLKCDGIRPQCGQCSQRDQSCLFQVGPPNRRGPGKKNRLGSSMPDSPHGPGPVSPRQRASKRKGTMETMILDLGDPVPLRRDMPPVPPGAMMGVIGPPPGYMPYPGPPPPGPPQ
ncbi:hypothetical protein DACRYDRAFT_21389 [Dacryopinax primogenitus]|uniref:Zn(2)-C6 fungal-type domain-containing protein n=1 Tax=Dacryopinax primogenitus (strain DJM 731) TaxID=1858805 RepID=M5GE75_DACPD|nr:uncharacterized protein DACRYDRAFT_21389 [Dacryopinax primogenitus]EJU03043.1 hypothetical protein DACRYDRAFT_21389 [Dacryopinax primogenitus]